MKNKFLVYTYVVTRIGLNKKNVVVNDVINIA